jgi:predicted short-subunit dehydrogenase-like oxidoreductase (DUF2520 family)
MANSPTVAIAGAGRTGQIISLLLQLLGYKLTTVISRQPTCLKLAYSWTPPPQVIPYGEYFPQPNLLIIATPDDAIASTANRIVATVRNQWSPKSDLIAWHCSGARSSLELKELQAIGAQVGSVHPLKSMAMVAGDLATLSRNFQGVFWGLEGDPAAIAIGQQLVTATQGQVIPLTAAQKPLYHAAAVLACGHLVALVDISQRLLQECGLPITTAQDMLLPLIKGTVENLPHGTAAALTGPFARRDWQTINLHLQALMNLNPDYVTVYSLLGKQAWDLKSPNFSSPPHNE